MVTSVNFEKKKGQNKQKIYFETITGPVKKSCVFRFTSQSRNFTG